MSSVDKILKAVSMYPEPFVKALSVLVMAAGFTGLLLDLLTPVPAFIIVLGIGLWGFQDRIADKIRSSQEEMLQEMKDLMQAATQEVEK